MSTTATAPAYEGLLYTVFQQLRQRAHEKSATSGPAADTGLVFAFTSANKGEGVSHTIQALLAGLASEGSTRALVAESGSLRALNVVPEDVKRLCSPISQGANPPLWELRPSATRSAATHSYWDGSWEYRRETLDHLRLFFDYVLIDCPALRAATDILSIAPFADGVILIVEAGKTRKEQVINAQKSIEFARGKFLGHILNKRSYVIPEWLYRRL